MVCDICYQFNAVNDYICFDIKKKCNSNSYLSTTLQQKFDKVFKIYKIWFNCMTVRQMYVFYVHIYMSKKQSLQPEFKVLQKDLK